LVDRSLSFLLSGRLQAEGAVGAGARLKSLHSIDDDEGLEVRAQPIVDH
jgi:hypothetical protein